jgi:hypothetical protein
MDYNEIITRSASGSVTYKSQHSCEKLECCLDLKRGGRREKSGGLWMVPAWLRRLGKAYFGFGRWKLVCANVKIVLFSLDVYNLQHP